ncbi:MAG: hypothetical protein M0Z28_24375 [Rhodospirillales bacterium]|nr:hypothetical protein [Rhodospirillales bacterium]
MRGAMWNEPYLETCCRATLHRLTLAGALGRPAGLKDGPCLERLAGMGLAEARADGRYELTASGVARHRTEVLNGATGAGRQQRRR